MTPTMRSRSSSVRSFFLLASVVGSAGWGCAGADGDADRATGEGLPRGDETITRITSALTTTGGITADSYVLQSTPTTNYGTATSVQVDANDGVAHGYVKLTVGDVGTISSAKLRVYCTNSSNGPNTVRLVSDNSWTEAGIIWNNKPATGATVATIGSVSSGTWVEVDVTSVVAPNSTVSLAFVPGTNDGFDFASRNNGTASHRPEVVINSGGSGGGTGGSGTGGAGSGGAGTGGAGTGGAGTGGSGTGGAGACPGSGNTDANLKIAFVGDTADGSNYTSVLNLVKNEGAQGFVVAGDMTYAANPTGWWNATEAVLGTSFPVFLSRGNHDDTSWSGFLPKAANHLGGACRQTASGRDDLFKTIFRGLDMVAIHLGDTGAAIDSLFGADASTWKVCYWHQNMNKLQVGGKGDEMGYQVYDTCRAQGAIVINGHEHSYHRTKTMTNMSTQTVDTTCPAGNSVCVGPGRSWLAVVGTGGTGLRSQVRCAPTEAVAPFASLNTSDPSCPLWASIYTTNQGANYGALFITFNVGGNPKRATAYFKDIAGGVIDSFTVNRD